MQRTTDFHSLLDTWKLVFATGSEEWFTNYPAKITKALWYFSVELIFLGTSCNYKKAWLYHARDMPLRSCVPVFHLLPCWNPLICRFFFSANEEPKSYFSRPLHHLAQPSLLFPFLPSQTGTRLPTLPCRPAVFLLHLFWSCSWL